MKQSDIRPSEAGARPMRVLHVYQNSKVGGIQQQILNLMRAYDRTAVEPFFCCMGPKREIGREIEALGVEVTALGRTRYSHFTPGIVLDLYRIIRDRRIDVLRTHKYRANLYGRLAGILARVPVIVASEHNTYKKKERRLHRRTLNRLLSLGTDRMIAVSEAIREDMVRFDRISPGRVEVIYNAVDTSRFDPSDPRHDDRGHDVRAELGIGPEDPVVGFVGRFVENKGLLYLTRAMASVLMLHPSARLLLVGDGSESNRIMDAARAHGIGEAIIMTGIRRDIPALLASMDVFVLPSVKEGLGTVVLEAMAMGKPVVATAVGGIPEMVRDGETGTLVPPADPAALAGAISALLGDRAIAGRLGAAGAALVRAGYGLDATARKWESLYRTLLEAGSGRKQI